MELYNIIISQRNSVIGKMLVSWSGDIGSSPFFAHFYNIKIFNLIKNITL